MCHHNHLFDFGEGTCIGVTVVQHSNNIPITFFILYYSLQYQLLQHALSPIVDLDLASARRLVMAHLRHRRLLLGFYQQVELGR